MSITLNLIQYMHQSTIVLIILPCILSFVFLLPILLHFLNFKQASLLSQYDPFYARNVYFGVISWKENVSQTPHEFIRPPIPIVLQSYNDTSSDGKYITGNYTAIIPSSIFQYFGNVTLHAPNKLTAYQYLAEAHKTSFNRHLGLKPGVLLLIPFLVYILYPLRYRGKQYFEERNYQSIIIEYKLVRRILWVLIPILTVFTFVTAVTYCIFHNNQWYNIYYFILSTIHIILLYAIISGLIWLLYHRGRKEFYFFYAESWIKKISENTKEADKMECLVHGLCIYNKYIIKNLKLRLANMEAIYSKITSGSNIQMHEH